MVIFVKRGNEKVYLHYSPCIKFKEIFQNVFFVNKMPFLPVPINQPFIKINVIYDYTNKPGVRQLFLVRLKKDLDIKSFFLINFEFMLYCYIVYVTHISVGISS